MKLSFQRLIYNLVLIIIYTPFVERKPILSRISRGIRLLIEIWAHYTTALANTYITIICFKTTIGIPHFSCYPRVRRTDSNKLWRGSTHQY